LPHAVHEKDTVCISSTVAAGSEYVQLNKREGKNIEPFFTTKEVGNGAGHSKDERIIIDNEDLMILVTAHPWLFPGKVNVERVIRASEMA